MILKFRHSLICHYTSKLWKYTLSHFSPQKTLQAGTHVLGNKKIRCTNNRLIRGLITAQYRVHYSVQSTLQLCSNACKCIFPMLVHCSALCSGVYVFEIPSIILRLSQVLLLERSELSKVTAKFYQPFPWVSELDMPSKLHKLTLLVNHRHLIVPANTCS